MHKLSFFSEHHAVNSEVEEYWKEYHGATHDENEPRELLKEVVALMKESQDKKTEKIAIELGCGSNGRNVKFLLKEGYSVFAVDQQRAIDMMLPKMAALFPELIDSKLTVYAGDICNIKEFPKADIISASYVLPFIPPEKFNQVCQILKASLKEGGYFAVDFFGPEDDWACDPKNKGKWTFHTRKDIEAMFSGTNFAIAQIQEDNSKRATATGGQKNWHVFHVKVLKKAGVEDQNRLYPENKP